MNILPLKVNRLETEIADQLDPFSREAVHCRVVVFINKNKKFF